MLRYIYQSHLFNLILNFWTTSKINRLKLLTKVWAACPSKKNCIHR